MVEGRVVDSLPAGRVATSMAEVCVVGKEEVPPGRYPPGALGIFTVATFGVAGAVAAGDANALAEGVLLVGSVGMEGNEVTAAVMPGIAEAPAETGGTAGIETGGTEGADAAAPAA